MKTIKMTESKYNALLAFVKNNNKKNIDNQILIQNVVEYDADCYSIIESKNNGDNVHIGYFTNIHKINMNKKKKEYNVNYYYSHSEKAYQLDIEGYSEKPIYNDYVVIGKKEVKDGIDKINLLEKYKDEYQNFDIRKFDMVCQHCNTNRKRNKVFLLKNVISNTNDYKIVGKSCLKDFLPNIIMDNIESEYKFYSFMNELEDEDNEGIFCKNPKISNLYKTQYILMLGLNHIKKHGYKSKKQDEFNNTSDNIKAIIYNNNYKEVNDIIINKELLDEVNNIKDKIINHLNNKNNLSPYEYNLINVLTNEVIDISMTGIAVSLFPYHYQITKEKDNVNKSEHIGNVGDKLTNIELNVVSCHPFETIYGINFIYIFQDINGNIYKYMGKHLDLNKGDTIQIKSCKIKSHDVYNNVKQTAIYYIKY